MKQITEKHFIYKFLTYKEFTQNTNGIQMVCIGTTFKSHLR